MEQAQGDMWRNRDRNKTSSGTSSSGPQSRTEIPIHERKWIDVEPEENNAHFFSVAKEMIKSLRHELPHVREEDGAIAFKNLAPMLVSQIESSPYWSIRTWLNHLQRGGGVKKSFQYCVCGDSEPNTRTLSKFTTNNYKSTPQSTTRAGALMLPSSCLDGSVTPVCPGLNPQYTGAPKAGGGCGLLTRTQNEPTITTW